MNIRAEHENRGLKLLMRAGHENYETLNMKCDQYDFEAVNIRAKHESDETENVKCDLCDFEAKNNWGLKIHIRAEHENDESGNLK